MATTLLPGAAEPFMLPVDDELSADLAAVGAEIRPMTADDDGTTVTGVVLSTTEPARIDAVVSTLLRRMGEIDRDAAQHLAAHTLELRALQDRYSRRVGKLQTERAWVESFARHLAKVQHDSGGFGTKRSRDVGYGTYGVRTIPSRIEVADEPAFVQWAEVEAPDLLRVTVKLALAEAREYLSKTELQDLRREVLLTPVRAFAESSEELPPGVRRTEEGVETFARPEPLR